MTAPPSPPPPGAEVAPRTKELFGKKKSFSFDGRLYGCGLYRYMTLYDYKLKEPSFGGSPRMKISLLREPSLECVGKCSQVPQLP